MYDFKRLSEISKRVLVPAGIQMQYLTNLSSWTEPLGRYEKCKARDFYLIKFCIFLANNRFKNIQEKLDDRCHYTIIHQS